MAENENLASILVKSGLISIFTNSPIGYFSKFANENYIFDNGANFDSCRIQVSNSGIWVSNSKIWVSNSGIWVSNSGIWVSNSACRIYRFTFPMGFPMRYFFFALTNIMNRRDELN